MSSHINCIKAFLKKNSNPIRPIYYLPYVSRVANETQIYISDLLHEDEVPFTFTSDAATADLKPKDKKGFLGKWVSLFEAV